MSYPRGICPGDVDQIQNLKRWSTAQLLFAPRWTRSNVRIYHLQHNFTIVWTFALNHASSASRCKTIEKWGKTAPLGEGVKIFLPRRESTPRDVSFFTRKTIPPGGNRGPQCFQAERCGGRWHYGGGILALGRYRPLAALHLFFLWHEVMNFVAPLRTLPLPRYPPPSPSLRSSQCCFGYPRPTSTASGSLLRLSGHSPRII